MHIGSAGFDETSMSGGRRYQPAKVANTACFGQSALPPRCTRPLGPACRQERAHRLVDKAPFQSNTSHEVVTQIAHRRNDDGIAELPNNRTSRHASMSETPVNAPAADELAIAALRTRAGPGELALPIWAAQPRIFERSKRPPTPHNHNGARPNRGGGQHKMTPSAGYNTRTRTSERDIKCMAERRHQACATNSARLMLCEEGKGQCGLLRRRGNTTDRSKQTVLHKEILMPRGLDGPSRPPGNAQVTTSRRAPRN